MDDVGYERLAGDFGGMFGLLLGGSILSVAEILDLLLYNAVIKLTMMKRVRPRPRLVQIQSSTL